MLQVEVHLSLKGSEGGRGGWIRGGLGGMGAEDLHIETR